MTQQILATRPGKGHRTPQLGLCASRMLLQDITGLTADAPMRADGYASAAHSHPWYRA